MELLGTVRYDRASKTLSKIGWKSLTRLRQTLIKRVPPNIFSPFSSLCLGICSRPPYPTLPSSKPSTSTAWPLSWTEGENLPLIFKKRSNCTPGFSSAYFSPSRLDFVGATCPGFDPEADTDWKGCSSDVRWMHLRLHQRKLFFF